ncbi:glycosyltransferase family 2 protein [Candidatus Microgenomates bacterium]|nr:glycosyltransferase family 2 protein [Candidatus Microgenomates bacterium]
MSYFFQTIFRRYPIKTQRALEVLPGFFSWSLILFPVWGSFLVPMVVAYFILFYNVYWFYKSFSLAIIATIAHRRIKRAEKEDWVLKTRKIKNFAKVRHLIIIPNYKERLEKLRKTLEHIAGQTISRKRLFVVLAMEEREGDVARERAKALLEEFKNVFGGFYTTFHPDTEGEVKGKSSNQAFAGIWAKRKLVDEQGFDINFMTVSSVDADTLFDKQYFAYLTYLFLTDKNRYRRFWQSATVYYNNIWYVPAAIRILSIIGSIWRTGILLRHERLIPNGTYSLSLKMLDNIGYWDTDVIPEDYRIFFKAFYRLGGNVSAAPIFLRTSMDAAQSTSYIKSLKNKYEQEKRWAWGVSDDPLFIKWWLTVPNVSFFDKTSYLLRVLSDHFLWPVNWFIITIGANVIPIVNPVFARTALGYNLPRLSSLVLASCLVALVVMIIIDYRQRPKRPAHISRLRHILQPVEYILMPISGFFLSALPGLIAHINLMLGKRLEYKVTEKI